MNYTEELLRYHLIEDHRQTLPRHRGRSWTTRPPNKLQGLVVHQSLEERGLARGIASYHVGPNHISTVGLPSLSYTLFIEKDGAVLLANDVEDRTWSQGYADPNWVDENALYLSVCVGGNFSGPGYRGSQVPTKAQVRSLSQLWGICSDLWEWADTQLFGHFHFGKPACPGTELLEFIYALRPYQFVSMVDRQVALQKLNHYDGEVDGVWGPKSKAALVSFQRKEGIPHDGAWGEATTEAIISRLSGVAL